MFDTVLVADRGVLACRVVRTCQALGARAVTVHSAADARRLHSACADESVLLGPADPASSYLDGLKVIEAAGQAGAQAVHPGAGPLARSAAFASAVQDAGLTWVGPPPEVLAALQQPGGAASPTEALVTVLCPPDRPAVALADASRRGGRCSAPAALPADVREVARSAAVEAATTAGVVGLVQAAVEPSRGFAVTRLSPWLELDHRVVELVTGADLVELQLRVAARGGSVDPVEAPGGAAAMVVLRARAAGRLAGWRLPEVEEVRVDVGCHEGEDVSPADGPLLTLAAWGLGADEADERLRAACDQLAVDGIELEEDA